ncbi:MAG: TIGR02206 family membrane protein [Sandaracinus sp.]
MHAPPFQPFGLLHLVTVAIVLTVIAAVVAWGRRVPATQARAIARGLGVILAVYYVVEGVVRVTLLGVEPVLLLPMELCSALFFIGAYALYTHSAIALEVLFFWAFAGTVHALITPTPGEGFPSLEYVRYFVCHGLLVLVATYAVLALDLALSWRSALRALLALQLWELVVAVVDLALDQNFMYLRHAPPSPTLIDSLGPWPVYLVSLELVGTASFFLWLGVALAVRKVLPVRAAEATAP